MSLDLGKRRMLYVGILVHFNILVAYAIFRTQHKIHHYLFDTVTSHWVDFKLENITQEGKSHCPKYVEQGFCETPCWAGPEYVEPEFVLTPNCTQQASNDLIFYVYSALGNEKRRDFLREKFHEAMRLENHTTAAIFFVVGLPATQKDNIHALNVDFEHKNHKDILQIDIPDLYTNLAFKGLAALRWVKQCSARHGKQYVIKLDDDSLGKFTEMKYLLRTAKEMRKRHDEVKDDLVCLYVMYEVLVYEPKQKPHWESTFHQYYARKYPHFCQGAGGMFMTPHVAESLLNAAKGLPTFHLDDNYISGFLRERACIKIRDWSGIYSFLESLSYTFLNLYSHEEWHAYTFLQKDIDRQQIDMYSLPQMP